ncbi:hypothetical protein EDB89DRAFT_1907451 [Lactarius sanguifluus]|nr:hypothetical protein EDB89DRAFT_1907451 [Lactarius sanguifluus]
MSYCVSRHTGTGSVVELAMQKVTFFGNNRKSESNADIIRKPNVQATHPCNWFTPRHPAHRLLFDPRKFSTTTTPPHKLQITPHHAVATRKTTTSSAYYDKPCHRCLAVSPRVSSWPPSPPIHDLHHQYLAARKPPEPRHDMQDPPLTRLRTLSESFSPDTIATSPCTSPAMAATTNPSPRHPTRPTRPQPPTHQHDATTQLARPHNRQPTAMHPDPACKATNPVTVTSQHGAQDYNPPPPTHRHTPTWRPTPQPPTHCHGAAHDAQDSATANPRYAATAHTHYIIPRRNSMAASYNLA